MLQRRFVMMRIPLLLLAIIASVGGTSPAASLTTSGAAGFAEKAGVPRSLNAISCPSVSVCFGVGERGTILATHDAGHTWVSEHGGTAGALLAIDCPAVSVCFAVAVPSRPGPTAFLHTTNGGRTWTETRLPAGTSSSGQKIACPSVTTCYTLIAGPPPSGSAVSPVEMLATTDGGSHWQVRGPLPAAMGSQYELGPSSSLACPGTTVCYAGGFNTIGWTTDGGHTWETRNFVDPQGCPSEAVCRDFTAAMACPSATTCYAGGGYGGGGRFTALVATTLDGGRTWQLHLISDLGGPVSLTCATRTGCFALGWSGRIGSTADGGTSWHVGRITIPYPFAALACPSATTCYAVGSLGRVMGTVNSGRTWHDLIPGIFVTANWSARQRPSDLHLHTYSRWFTATHPWQVALDVYGGGSGCQGLASVTIYVQNAAGRRIGAPVHSSFVGFGQYGKTLTVTGRLRLDVVSHCFDVAVRIDGVA